MFGPLGPSLAPQIRASKTLTRILTPVANLLARASGHRQLGLKYDDLLQEEREDVQKALARLSPSERYERAWRIRRAMQQSILHKNLPKHQWITPEEDVRYLQPLVEQVVKEDKEREYWDTVEVVRKQN